MDHLQGLIEAEIKKQRFGNEPRSLYEPLRYIMALGGKRLRPLLTLLSYRLYKSNPETIVPIAVAVEVFHNFTLLHDDVMDNAPLRRGRKTVHEKWDVNTAILSGDVMQIKVYELLLQISDPQLRIVLAAFNRCAIEVCEGQQLDMMFESKTRVTERDYINMIGLKTATLLGFSLELGAILASASPEDRTSLRAFGMNVGIAFQLRDDLLDVYADKKKFGKQVGGDIISNKKTFLLIKALSLAKGSEKKELMRWLKMKKFAPQKKVDAITRIYDSLGVRAETEKMIKTYFDGGYSQLDSLRQVNTKELIQFTEALRNRET